MKRKNKLNYTENKVSIDFYQGGRESFFRSDDGIGIKRTRKVPY